MLYRLLTFLVFAAVVIGLGEWDAKNQRFAFNETVNQAWLNFCVGNARDKINDPAVTFVSIGDDYEPVLEGDQLSRLDYAVLLGNVEHFKPRAVAVAPPITFKEENIINQGALKKQVLKMPRLVLGSIADAGTAPADDSETPDYPVLTKVDGDTSKLPEIKRAAAMPDEEPRANGVAAFTEIELLDDAGAADQLPLAARVGDKVVASFALLALVADADLTLDDVTVKLSPKNGESEITIGDRYTIPVDSSGRLASYPNSGVAPPAYPIVDAKHLPLASSDDPEIAARRNELGDDFDSLKKNLVVIGKAGKDTRQISLSNEESYSQHELIARAIAVVQSGRYISKWPDWAKYAGIALIVVLALLLFRLRRMPLLFWGFVCAFLYVFGICLGSFKEWLVWTPPFVPLALFAGIVGIGLILPSSSERAVSSDEGENKEDSDEENSAPEGAASEESQRVSG
jgi:hypothetical protein